MNAASSCHEIPGAPNLYVDAFIGKYLLKTNDDKNAFVLTHYHGDHYGNLPKEGKYRGPALIHCTPVTASLLRNVHEVPDKFIVEHPYGETWTLFRSPPQQGDCKKKKKNGSSTVRITFYDANHCPGAAIVVIELIPACNDEGGSIEEEEKKKVHVHTGDMRYHKRMKSYPLLREAALNKKIDCVLLDTTYANPKHDFIPQETAIDSIASQVQRLLLPHNNNNNNGEGSSLDSHGYGDGASNPKTLVLLSCYSIGKEKVLWEASLRTNQLVYVSDKKLRMLQCIEGHEESVSSKIVHRTTQDSNESDIHVVPMGLAGEMWPYFRPNYFGVADYALDLNKKYDKVVAFIPTGWADATNWNKKNALSSRSNCKGIDVEIRLISYSEHSAYSELQSFIQFLNPRKITPTVFKDANDMRKIEARFPVDTGRAKRHFFSSMTKKASNNDETQAHVTATATSERDRTEMEEASPRAATSCSSDQNLLLHNEQYNDGISSLVAMGFDSGAAKKALESCKGNVESAVESLLIKGKNVIISPSSPSPSKRCCRTEGSPSPINTTPSKRPKGQQQQQQQQQQSTIKSFFVRKGT